MTVYYLPILLVAVSSRLLLLRSCIFPTVILSTFHCIVPVLYAVARLFFQSGLASKQVRCAGLGLERDVAYTISSSAMIRHDLAYRVPAVFMFSFLYNKSQKKKKRNNVPTDLRFRHRLTCVCFTTGVRGRVLTLGRLCPSFIRSKNAAYRVELM